MPRFTYYIQTLVFFLVSFSIFPLYGQNSIDSLRVLLEKNILKDEDKVDVLNNLGYEYWIVDTKQAIAYGGEALQLAESIDYISGIAKSRRIIGVSHWAQGNPKMALEYLTESCRIYESIGDTEGFANCLMNTGMVYADIREFTKAMEYYETAIDKFTALELKSRIATTFTKMADVFFAENRLLDAKKLLDHALAIHSEQQFSYGMGEVHNRLGRFYIETGELEQAEYHIRRSLFLRKGSSDEDSKIHNLLLYGKLLRLQNNVDTSEDHLKLALSRSTEKGLKKYRLSALFELKELKKQQGELEESLKYYDDYLALRDSIYNTDKSKQIAAIEFNNELQEKNIQLNYMAKIKKTDSTIKWLLGIGLTIITLLLVFLVKSLRLKHSKQQELLVSKEHLAITAMENQRLKQVELENQLHFKNKELTSYALNFVQKNELLEKLHIKLKEAKMATPKNQEKFLREMEHTIKQHKSMEKDWEGFKLHFEQVHSRLLHTLKDRFPNLSSNDLKVAALTRLNLSIKEASGILGISPESTKTARHRLRKKLKLSQDEDLYTFLSRLEAEN